MIERQAYIQRILELESELSKLLYKSDAQQEYIYELESTIEILTEESGDDL